MPLVPGAPRPSSLPSLTKCMLPCRIHVLATFTVTLATLSVITYAYTSLTPNDGSSPAKTLLPDEMPLIVYNHDRIMLPHDESRPYPPALAARKVDVHDTSDHSGSGSNTTNVSHSADDSNKTGNTIVLPAVISVALFVLLTFIALRLTHIYRERVTPSYRPPVVRKEPPRPRLWDVSLQSAAYPVSCSGKWCNLMPVTVQYLTEEKMDLWAGRPPPTMRSQPSRCSSRDSGQSFRSTSLEKHGSTSGTVDDSRVRVAVLVAMPALRCSDRPVPTTLGLMDVVTLS
ncbi:hypothetical protein C8Q74DRAFT_581564 [Fomes fomentarius]|nr:hypothetical protein C8Q74DRAFT_581564 [Fomes fomentarius]